MARRLRIDPEDGWHHVMNRGASRQRTFFSADDGNRFLSLVGEGHELFGIAVHAFCLMPNHFHLLVHCPNGGLSDFMQRIGTGYTRHVNLRRGTDGALFRGRYHSIGVGDEVYRSVVGRYIHRNPLALGDATTPAQYRWSSLRYYLTAASPPDWLRTEVLLAPHTSHTVFREFTLDDSGPAATASTISWAIDVVMHELFESADRDLSEQPHLHRTIAAIMLTLAQPNQSDVVNALLELAKFPNPEARRAALYRARRRSVEQPVLMEAAATALRLAA